VGNAENRGKRYAELHKVKYLANPSIIAHSIAKRNRGIISGLPYPCGPPPARRAVGRQHNQLIVLGFRPVPDFAEGPHQLSQDEMPFRF
jgi:hypothetical protein